MVHPAILCKRLDLSEGGYQTSSRALFKGLKFTTSLGFPLFILECLLTTNARHAQGLLEGSIRPLSKSSLISFAQNSLSEGDIRAAEAF